MNILNLIYTYSSDDLKWIRIRYIPYGLCLTKQKIRFSERNGFEGSIKIFGWRLKLLRGRI